MKKIAIIFTVIFVLAMFLVWLFFSITEEYYVTGEIKEKQYFPSQNSIGNSINFDSKSTVGLVSLHSYEKYIFIIQYEDGKCGSISVTANDYINNKIGSVVKVAKRRLK